MRTVLLTISLLVAHVGAARADDLALARRPRGASTAQRVQRAFVLLRTVRSAEERADPLSRLRERDRMLHFSPLENNLGGVGAAMMAAMCVTVAHAPRAVRVIFEAPVHVGPALFEHGGMGVGVGGRWM